MSAHPTELIGRVATLSGISSKPELNSLVVVVSSFSADTGRYVVQFHSVNPHIAPPVSVSVKRDNLVLSSILFEETFPDAPVMKVYCSSESDCYRTGVIVDFSCCPMAFQTPRFSTSCSVRGKTVRGGSGLNQGTPFLGWVEVELQNEDDLIEFEDISFSGVLCTSGKNIAFRRCHFRSSAVVKGLGTEVMFENCVFEGCAGAAVMVAEQGRCVLLHCTISKTLVGVDLSENGCATLTHCTIKDVSLIGVKMARCNSLTVQSCAVSHCKGGGIFLCEGGAVVIEKCYIEHCGMGGIVIQGPNRCIATVTDTVVTDCAIGLVTMLGKTTVTIAKCQLLNNIMTGLHIAEHTVGNVDVTDTIIAGNLGHDICHEGKSKSSLVVDGVLQPTSVISKGLKHLDPATARSIREKVAARTVAVPEPSTSEQFLILNRARKMAGLGSVYCTACGKEEPPGKKFNACARCTNVCYCSKECQVKVKLILTTALFIDFPFSWFLQIGHWKEHKKACKNKQGQLKPVRASGYRWYAITISIFALCLYVFLW